MNAQVFCAQHKCSSKTVRVDSLICIQCTSVFELHSPPMFVDRINFGLVLYNQANFYQFEETSSYWSVKRISFFHCFPLVNQLHTSGITVYNCTVTNIENTLRAVHSCNSWFSVRFHLAIEHFFLFFRHKFCCLLFLL